MNARSRSAPCTFARRISGLPPAYLDELFRVSSRPGVISFAGGLPDATFFDTQGIACAAREVMEEEGRAALQYTTTDGYLPLRKIIADRYHDRLGLKADPGEIQIVNGSQQCLDLMGKILLDPGSGVIIEEPGYLGAIDAFSFYEPSWYPVPLSADGPDSQVLASSLEKNPAMMYAIPNSQNPSGTTWSLDMRREVAGLLEGSGTILYEDDAFGELFFDGKAREPVKRWLSHQTVMSGSFSKIIAPGLRIGWIWAPEEILGVFNRAKQAADLHSNLLSQMILTRYLEKTDIGRHTRDVSARYGERCRLMTDLAADLLPGAVIHSSPEGGMFLMLTLPPGTDPETVFREGIQKGVAVMPGTPFYLKGRGAGTIRLNFSSPGEEEIKTGMERLGTVLRRIQ